jgi:hypothetical protein
LTHDALVPTGWQKQTTLIKKLLKMVYFFLLPYPFGQFWLTARRMGAECRESRWVIFGDWNDGLQGQPLAKRFLCGGQDAILR